MHERAAVAALVRRAEQVVASSTSARAVAVGIRIGALSHLSPDHLAEHFERDAEGTAVEGARLDIEVSVDASDPRAQEVVLTHVDVIGTA